MGRAFIVIGPESSGTRMLTEVLVKAGCEGDYGHEQRWDTEEIKGDLVVWRRSYPHLQEPVEIKALLERLKDYEVKVIITTRDFYPMARSSVLRGHCKTTDEALNRMNDAYCKVFAQLKKLKLPFIVVSYENLALNKNAINVLLAELKLPLTNFEITNQNEKYY